MAYRVTEEGAAMTPSRIRDALWANEYRPVRIRAGLKFPTEDNWHSDAKLNPPKAVTDGPDAAYPNTGIVTAGLRVLDIDLNDPETVTQIAAYALDSIGHAPIRYRANSNRLLLPYRAAEGAPRKRKCWNRQDRKSVV